jgi:hypothetical protein
MPIFFNPKKGILWYETSKTLPIYQKNLLVYFDSNLMVIFLKIYLYLMDK